MSLAYTESFLTFFCLFLNRAFSIKLDCHVKDFSWSICFISGIFSGLKKTFTKRYIVEMTNKARIRPEKQSEPGELSGGFME